MTPYAVIILNTLSIHRLTNADEVKNLVVDLNNAGRSFLVLKYDTAAHIYKQMEVLDL